jgi:hypothetical protein
MIVGPNDRLLACLKSSGFLSPCFGGAPGMPVEPRLICGMLKG